MDVLGNRGLRLRWGEADNVRGVAGRVDLAVGVERGQQLRAGIRLVGVEVVHVPEPGQDDLMPVGKVRQQPLRGVLGAQDPGPARHTLRSGQSPGPGLRHHVPQYRLAPQSSRLGVRSAKMGARASLGTWRHFGGKPTPCRVHRSQSKGGAAVPAPAPWPTASRTLVVDWHHREPSPPHGPTAW